MATLAPRSPRRAVHDGGAQVGQRGGARGRRRAAQDVCELAGGVAQDPSRHADVVTRLLDFKRMVLAAWPDSMSWFVGPGDTVM
jgi:hypothetical protein